MLGLVWTGGAPSQVQEGSAWEPITRGQIRLRRQGTRKNEGDRWLGTTRTGAPAGHLAGCLGTHDGEVGRRNVAGPSPAGEIIYDP